MDLLDRTEELFNKLLDEHPPELILGALDEMLQMNRNELLAFGTINRVDAGEVEKAEKDKNHQPD